MPKLSKALLLNAEVLAIDQDPLGRMCFRFQNHAALGASGWRKELANGDVAVALVNMGDERPQTIRFAFADAGFAPDTRVKVRDVFAQADLGQRRTEFISPPIAPHGTLLLRLAYAPFDKGEL